LSESLQATLRSKHEENALDKPHFDAGAKLIVEKDGVYLEMATERSWLSDRTRSLVTAELLGRVVIPDLPFENPDGSRVVVDRDYLGGRRNPANPSPGPFEIDAGGRQRIKVWGKRLP
jgi:alpha-N-arabinofuranosidase